MSFISENPYQLPDASLQERPALFFVTGPLKSGKTTLCKRLRKEIKHCDLISPPHPSSNDDNIESLINEVFPRHGIDATRRPVVVDGFPHQHEEWKDFNKGSGVLAGGEEVMTKIRADKKLTLEGRIMQERAIRKVLVVRLDCLESAMLMRWRNDQKKDKRREEAQEEVKRELQSQNDDIKTMLDNMKGGNLIEIVELKAVAVEDIEATMKRWMAEIRKTGTWEKCST